MPPLLNTLFCVRGVLMHHTAHHHRPVQDVPAPQDRLDAIKPGDIFSTYYRGAPQAREIRHNNTQQATDQVPPTAA